MSKFSRRNSKPDCTPHDKSSHHIYPPELSNVFSRIDPIPDLPPFYVGKDSPLSNPVSNPTGMKALPIESFEQLLDRKDLNSIQL